MRLTRGTMLYELAGFFGSSLVALVADVGIFSLLTALGAWPFGANVVSALVAGTITYLLSTRFTFRVGTAWSTYVGYIAWTLLVIGVFSYFIQTAITMTGWPAPLWKVMFAPVSFVFNFIFTRALFRRHQRVVSRLALAKLGSTTLQVVMPMAGMGSRFASAGWTVPKPLINVGGMPMFERALSSLDGLPLRRRVVLVVQQAHIDEHGIDTAAATALPGVITVAVPALTRGAAETALAAATVLDPEDPLVVMDCDLWFSSKSYNEMVVSAAADPESIAGGLLTFTSRDPRYSYAETRGDLVVRTAEKVAISDHAITGAYFFSKARYFIEAAQAQVASPLEGEPEYYLSSVYNALIKSGRRVSWSSVDSFASFGTPEELAAFERRGPDRS